MSWILVINSGSSSLKYALVDDRTGDRAASGSITRIGESTSIVEHAAGSRSLTMERPVEDHDAALVEVLRWLGEAGVREPDAVGHRVVHGGDRFSEPCVINSQVVEAIVECVPLAPLHNPACLEGIAAAIRSMPEAPQVAVFDTAFHSTIPAAARTYAIDAAVARDHRIRRYGFHGTSHQFVSRRAAQVLGIPLADTALITLHLGNGASACAVLGGRSIETSMGVTPLEGLVMGTRSGDIDPSVPEILGRAGWSAGEIDDLLNTRSGLLGLCGANDMREVHVRADSGDEHADLAREVYAHRIRKYVGAYLATLGRADAIVFTAGVGEHDPWVRAATCRGLGGLGVSVDLVVNAMASGERDISGPGASIRVLIVPTDEEHAIAKQTADLLAAAAGSHS